jgi:hypothetical protein
MKKYLGVLCLLLVALLFIMVGLTLVESGKPELDGEAWCDAMVDKPNQDWTDAEAERFGKNCLFNNQDL